MNTGRTFVREDFLKKSVVERVRPQQISHVAFGMFTGPEISKLSQLQVCSKELYTMATRKPAANGCLDQRLGVSNTSDTCLTCGRRLQECSGHTGFIPLELPVFHIGFFKATLAVLQCVCKSCGRVLLEGKHRQRHLLYMRNPAIDPVRKSKNFKTITEECTKVRCCPYCGYANGPVRKVPGAAALKVTHDRYRLTQKESDVGALTSRFSSAMSLNADVRQLMQGLDKKALLAKKTAEGESKDDGRGTKEYKHKDDISPLDALNLMKKIPDEDLDLLWISTTSGRPESLIVTHLLVPPVCIRPSVAMDAGAFNEDDLTVKLQEIISTNLNLRLGLSKGLTTRNMMETWDFLQSLVGSYINGDLPGFPSAVKPKKPIRGLCQRLKGKSGRFRQNLLGKRVDFSGRTVISPDPNLALHEVGVPRRVASILTYPERVTSLNMERLRQAVRNGTEYPGARNVRFANGSVKNLEYGDKQKVARDLRIGDVVDRHMIDGDVVLFNRQPSLHKMSIMSHRARVMDYRTFRFNECVCPPYNADFDGDEMNLHLPQTEEARTEAALLMDVRENLVTPRSGEPLITANQDFLTACFLLSQRRVFLTRDEFCSAAAYVADAKEHVEVPIPAILKPVPLWTGKQLLTLLLCPSKEAAVRVNLSLKERNYSDRSETHKQGFPILCPAEGYVVIRNGELMAGNWGKGTLGGSKKGLIYTLIRDHSPHIAARFMHRMTKLSTRWFTNYGFSIGIEDVTPDDALYAAKEEYVFSGYQECQEKIRQFKEGTLVRLAGCDAEQTLENQLNGILGRVRAKVGELCKQELPPHNAPLVMENCGSKGSALNICQMIACVGQQAVNGARIPDGFIHRSLPAFRHFAKEPAAKGFVVNSFYSGITATEFFFHTMGGREGLVDTAVKTALTGYMQRRMVKAMEDFFVQYDGTVRGAADIVVQFDYGDDGLDPAFMESNKKPVDFPRLFMTVQARCGFETGAVAMTPDELRSAVRVALKEPRFASLCGLLHEPPSREDVQEGHMFLKELRVAVDDIASRLEEKMIAVGLDAPEGMEVSFDPSSEVYAKWMAWLLSTRSEESVKEAMTVIMRTGSITSAQLQMFFSEALNKFHRARVQPGEAVGVAAAHSLGEPATQMTLKTFHFAGVASMNVTLGVPRITEIINANVTISTPIIDAALVNETSEIAGRIVKGRVERTTLGDIAEYVQEVYGPSGCCLEVKLDMEAIESLYLGINAISVASAIVNELKPKLRHGDVHVMAVDRLVVTPPPDGFRTRGSAADKKRQLMGEDFFSIQSLKTMLPPVTVQGIHDVSRAVISQREDSNGSDPRYHLLVEGGNLLRIMGTEGVLGSRCKSNHVMEVEQTLGIEAARNSIMIEIMVTYNDYGIALDRRHLSVLADTMTYRGSVLGITRFGIEKMKESVLGNASFEKTPDHLFDAAVHSRVDSVDGVSACIILGIPMALGTGSFKLMHQPISLDPLPKKPPLLLSRWSRR